MASENEPPHDRYCIDRSISVESAEIKVVWMTSMHAGAAPAELDVGPASEVSKPARGE
jgi:hypothetical protein